MRCGALTRPHYRNPDYRWRPGRNRMPCDHSDNRHRPEQLMASLRTLLNTERQRRHSLTWPRPSQVRMNSPKLTRGFWLPRGIGTLSTSHRAVRPVGPRRTSLHAGHHTESAESLVNAHFQIWGMWSHG